jgi:hypothetical protein
MGLSITIAAGSRQRSHSQVRTTFYSLRFETLPTRRTRFPYLYPPGTGWSGFTPRHWVPFSSLTTCRATVEVFNPASTWDEGFYVRDTPYILQDIQMLLYKRRINTRPLLGNESVNTYTTIEELLKAAFSVGSALGLYNEGPRSAEWMIETWGLAVQLSSAREAEKRWRYSWIPHGRLWQEDLTAWSWRISTVRSSYQETTSEETAGWKGLRVCCSNL